MDTTGRRANTDHTFDAGARDYCSASTADRAQTNCAADNRPAGDSAAHDIDQRIGLGGKGVGLSVQPTD